MRGTFAVALLALGVTIEACARDPVAAIRFRLRAERSQFTLQDLADTASRIAVPTTWLVPPREALEERENAVSSFAFDSQVTAFAIGDGRLGLHVASYQLNDAGSIHAAAGRDVFLVYDPSARVVRPGLVSLGVTRERVKAMSCLQARFSHFLLADVNGDGLRDLGRVQEVLQCDWKDNEPVSRPWYEQHPVSWYVLHDAVWERDPKYDGQLPARYTELPLLGLSSTPVDFFGAILWTTHDPARWESRGRPPPAYLPTYRRRLIAQEGRQGKP